MDGASNKQLAVVVDVFSRRGEGVFNFLLIATHSPWAVGNFQAIGSDLS